MTEKSQPETLNLDTLTAFPEVGIVIDAVWYPYAQTYNWSLRERSRFRAIYRQATALEQVDEPTDADAARYSTLRMEICQMAVPTAPDEKLAALKDVQRGALITDFLSRSSEPMKQLVPERHLALMQLASVMSQTGAQSSPVSSASTTRRTRKRG